MRGPFRFSGVMLGSGDPTGSESSTPGNSGRPGSMRATGTDEARAHSSRSAHREVKGQNDTPQRIMLTFEVPDVAEAFAELQRHGATVVAEPNRPEDDEGFWLATLADPDGNFVQLATPWSNG
jgi:predicted enzyme related to lactoylglutathione lyase